MLIKYLNLFHDKWVVISLACIIVNISVHEISYAIFCLSVLVGAFGSLACVGSKIFQFFEYGTSIRAEAFVTGCVAIMADMFVNNILYSDIIHYDMISVIIGLTTGIVYLIAEHIKAKL